MCSPSAFRTGSARRALTRAAYITGVPEMGKPAVIVIERDPTVIDIAQRCLPEEAELHVANSVELALRIAARRPIAVVVIDAPMAGAMPSDFIGKLRAQCPGVRAVFLTDPAFDF